MAFSFLDEHLDYRSLDGGRIFAAQPLCTRLGSEMRSERCAIYVRETEASVSALEQMTACTFVASAYNWQVSKALVAVDSSSLEEDLAGRNGFSELVRAAKEKTQPFTYLLINHPSTLSTDQHVAHALINLFNACGVIVCALNGPSDGPDMNAIPQVTMFL